MFKLVKSTLVLTFAAPLKTIDYRYIEQIIGNCTLFPEIPENPKLILRWILYGQYITRFSKSSIVKLYSP